MTIIELKDQIMKNQLSNFYIFVGEEIGIINIYLNQMSNKLALPIVRADSVSAIYSNCTRRTMFGSSTSIYVIREDKDFSKQEKLFETIKEDIGKNVIVLLFDKIDGRSKLNKAFKEEIVSFEKLAPNILKNYVRKKISLNENNLENLMKISNYSYDVCMLEADKIITYSDCLGLDYDKGFEKLLAEKQLCFYSENDIFKFTEFVMRRQASDAVTLEALLREDGNASVSILGTLYTVFKAVLLIQCCNGSNVGEVTGLDNGQIYFNKKYVGNYGTGELVAGLKLIASVVDGIKSGWIEDEYATRYVLSQIL